jgi:hypothetical protein
MSETIELTLNELEAELRLEWLIVEVCNVIEMMAVRHRDHWGTLKPWGFI